MPTTLQLRNGVASLAALASRDLAALWSVVATAVQARDALTEVLPALVDKYGSAAAALAADWYDDLRDEAGARGRFLAVPVELGDMGAVALAGLGVGPLFAADPDWVSAQSLIAGGLQRRIANAARHTITASSVADPGASGWQRVGRGGSSCAFCRMLISRGSVYTEARADFASHDSCNCGAVPAWDGQPLPVKPYAPSPRGTSPAERALARAWIADNQ